MNPAIESVCVALEQLAAKVESQGSPTFCFRDQGWNQPAIIAQDLLDYTRGIAARLRKRDPEFEDVDFANRLTAAGARLKKLHSETVQHLFNGNAVNAVPAYTASVRAIEVLVAPLLDWQISEDPKAMPAQLAKRVRAYRTELDSIESSIPEIRSKLKVISEAHSAAENLPVDLAALEEVRTSLKAALDTVEKAKSESAASLEKTKNYSREAEDLKKKAAGILAECEDTFRITTSKGLAAGFLASSVRLNRGIWFWIAALATALVVGSIAGAARIAALSALLNDQQTTHWDKIWMNVFMSLVSVGAPIWFAWLATKQIGQRFRLAEDYGYKAAVAQAYEGFRREAAKYSPKMAERLLESALDRLDEPPLRWVEQDSHGSPWHELVSSDAFRSALDKVPNLKEVYAAAAKKRKAKASLTETVNPASSP